MMILAGPTTAFWSMHPAAASARCARIPKSNGSGTTDVRPPPSVAVKDSRLRRSASKVGGILVYSTCTLTAEENERNRGILLARHPEFELEDAARYLPDRRSTWCRAKYFQALPHRDDTDGFFAARMRKVS